MTLTFHKSPKKDTYNVQTIMILLFLFLFIFSESLCPDGFTEIREGQAASKHGDCIRILPKLS